MAGDPIGDAARPLLGAALQVGQHALVQAGELRGRDRLVDLAPRHGVLGARLLHDVFVARRPPGKGSSRNRKAAAKGEFAFAPPDRMFAEHRGGLVPVHRAEVVHALPVEPEAAFLCGHPIVLSIKRVVLPGRASCGPIMPRPASAVP